MVLSITAVLITSCSEFALLASGSSIAVSQNAYVKAYNSVDVLTIVKTDKDIKRHLYDQIKDAKRERGRKWDGRSRISTSKYKKNYNEINWGNLDEITQTMKEDYERKNTSSDT